MRFRGSAALLLLLLTGCARTVLDGSVVDTHATADAELDFIRIAVATPGQTYTTIDLDDDLRRRPPVDNDPHMETAS